MASIDRGVFESLTPPGDPDYAWKIEKLFLAVESSNVAIVKGLAEDDLRHLCGIRRQFPSRWSPSNHEDQTAYQRACRLGHTEIVQCMINAGVAADQRFPKDNSTSCTRGAFMFACQSRSMSTIRVLLAAHAAVDTVGICSSNYAETLVPGVGAFRRGGIELYPYEELYPIHLAIADNNVQLIQELLTPTTNQLKTIGKVTPLHLACLYDRALTTIDLLLSYGDANVTITAQTANGTFPDELTTDPIIIEYLRPTRLLLCAELATRRCERHKRDLRALKEGAGLQIFISTFTGKMIVVPVTEETTVDDLKHRIELNGGIPYHQQRITLRGKQLEGELSMSDYNIRNGTTLQLFLSLEMH